MKTTTLIYCGPDGDAGKALASKLRADGTRAMLRDAATFNREIEQCDDVVIMPDVSNFHGDRLKSAYGGKCSGTAEKICRLEQIIADDRQAFAEHLPQIVRQSIPLTAKHRGRGKFYVMRGDVIVSGPHTKVEAQRLAA